jgi:hypothetical protein
MSHLLKDFAGSIHGLLKLAFDHTQEWFRTPTYCRRHSRRALLHGSRSELPNRLPVRRSRPCRNDDSSDRLILRIAWAMPVSFAWEPSLIPLTPVDSFTSYSPHTGDHVSLRPSQPRHLHVVLHEVRVAGSVPRSRSQDPAAAEPDLFRPGEDSGAGPGAGKLGVIRRAGSCWSTRLRLGEVAAI